MHRLACADCWLSDVCLRVVRGVSSSAESIPTDVVKSVECISVLLASGVLVNQMMMGMKHVGPAH